LLNELAGPGQYSGIHNDGIRSIAKIDR